MQNINQSSTARKSHGNDQEYWTGVSSSSPIAYDFHLTEPDTLIGEEFEPHTVIIHAIEPEISDDELDEFEARLQRDDQLRSVRQHITTALRSAQDTADFEGADSISRSLTAALRDLDQMEGGSARCNPRRQVQGARRRSRTSHQGT
jgi:hypothetical protein